MVGERPCESVVQGAWVACGLRGLISLLTSVVCENDSATMWL